ncbi:very-long-chain (3R)-3-hydroxyacyl-CoA dehydratase [Nematocida ausubeli]|nr:very-long-chain (3R)-3-hydroxyacyl-CoA dehydratase [Nematocida ausubeli]
MGVSVLKKAFSLYLVRVFFNLFGMAVSWLVISIGLDLLSESFNLCIPREYLFFLSGYSRKTYQNTLVIAQELYMFELLLSVFGITSQCFVTSAMQIGSRVFISRCACTHNNRIVTGLMVLIWGVSDMIRFLYYGCPLLKKPRYISSLILYPVGIFCEIFLMVYMRSVLTLIGLVTYIPGIRYLYGRIREKSKTVSGKSK